MPNRTGSRGWVAVAALAGAAAAAATIALVAQDRAPDQVPDRDRGPTFRAEANFVRVDVFATRDGEPVTDLGPDDFQLLDEGVPQRLEQFEYVRVQGNVPQDAREEPNTVAESRAMLENPRARVFVLFLDTPHVDPSSSRTIRAPLIEALDGLIGVDDLMAVMTPEMSAGDITFARRTAGIQGILDREWWGGRNRLLSEDPVEEQYKFCYPSTGGASVSAQARDMIDRRREKMTLDALGDLVRFLRGVREERKAILVITEGWRLFRSDTALLAGNDGRPPSLPPVGFDPRTGRLSTGGDRNSVQGARSDCDRDRMTLAMADTEQQFTRLLDEANRSNASFYPVDPRGLAVFDSPIGPDRPLSPDADRAQLRARQESLRTLADLTDGLAVVNSNNIGPMLRRVVTDLSSYYLLGYYATGVEMDGRFHKVTVRVARPGVDVRARRGYLAPSPEEMALASAAVAPAAAPSPDAAAEAHGLDEALGSLARFSRDYPLRVQVAVGWTPDTAAFWVVGEPGTANEWQGGGEVDVSLTTTDGEILATARADIEAGARSFRVALRAGGPLPPGAYAVRVRARGAAPGRLPASDVVTLVLPAQPAPVGALFVRRGPTTGNREVPTADLRFRRNERLRVEVSGVFAVAPTARLLDRTGGALAIPVSAAVREDADGARWVTADLALAPLTVGDYVLEVSTGAAEAGRVWAGFRIIP